MNKKTNKQKKTIQRPDWLGLLETDNIIIWQ